MSISSYLLNVELGATGPGTSTCKSGAAEQISPEHSLTPRNHRSYGRTVTRFNRMSYLEMYLASAEYEVMWNQVLANLGGITCDQVLWYEAKRRDRFVKKVSDLV